MEYTFVGSDGETYSLSPITMKDRQDLRAKVQYQEYHAFTKLKGEFTPEVFDEHCRAVMMMCSKKSRRDIIEDTDKFMQSEDGTAYLVYLHLRHNHKSITPARAADLITLDNASDIVRLLKLINPEVEGSKKNSTLTSESFTGTPQSNSAGLPSK